MTADALRISSLLNCAEAHIRPRSPDAGQAESEQRRGERVAVMDAASDATGAPVSGARQLIQFAPLAPEEAERWFG